MDPLIVDRLADARVLVVGDVMLDRFVEGKVARISREAPVPVLKFGAARAMMGGAGNVAANVLAAGGAVTLVGLIGDDEAARGFARLDARMVSDPARTTTLKTRYLSGWQQLLCIDSPDNPPATAATREKIVAAAIEALPFAAIVVISDYGRGTLDDDATRQLIAAAAHVGKPVIVDPRWKLSPVSARHRMGLPPRHADASSALSRSTRCF
jgi:D-beta-D-heptose 7-phosphate kinase/D-beta-D-heptose 1-phosphate adenosyltransferase